MNKNMTFDDVFNTLPDDLRRNALFRGAVAAAIISAQKEYKISNSEAAKQLGVSVQKLKKMKLGEA